jgi:hypothetical protein
MFNFAADASKLSLVIASILYFAAFGRLLLGLSFLDDIDFCGGDFDKEEVLFDCFVTLFLARVCFIFYLLSSYNYDI